MEDCVQGQSVGEVLGKGMLPKVHTGTGGSRLMLLIGNKPKEEGALPRDPQQTPYMMASSQSGTVP
jgi:hypothetical protein